MYKTIALLWSALLSIAAQAQHLDTAKLDAYFNTLEQHHKFMGSVALAQNGQLIYAKTIGWADANNNQKADVNTKYRIGSISKTFTAVLVMKAVEAKRLQLSDPISRYFPGLKNAASISVAQLISHQSGLHDFTDNDDYKDWQTQAKTEKEMLSIIAAGGSDFEPGQQVAYCNSNYVLLSYILEQVYKKPYASILKEQITKPLGLRNTALGGAINSSNNEAQSYAFSNGWTVAAVTDISIPLGAGGIISTPSDLMQFSHALFTGKIISKASLDIMKTFKESVGYGLFEIPFDDNMSYGHRGGIDKFTAVFSYFPKEKLSFALTSNGSNYNNNEIPITVLNAAFGQDFELPDFTVFEMQAEQLEQYTGQYGSEKLPFKIIISQKDNSLIAQAEGQSAMPLEAAAQHTFRFSQAGIVLVFDPEHKSVLLKQGGAEFLLSRE